jgi:uncharacterized membrane protein
LDIQAFLRKHETVLWLLTIVALASALRLFGLSFQSYWYDELFSAYSSNPSHSLNEVIRITEADVHPPLYQVVLWQFYKWFGYNEWAGRLPSALAGIACIPVIYGLGRELFDKRAGLYSAAFASVNYYLLYFSQEARSYAFLCFLCSLSFLYFFRTLRKQSWLNVALYILATVALLYTHYFGFVLLVAQVTALLIYFRMQWPPERALLLRSGVAAGVVIAACLPLIPVLLAHANVNDFWIQQPPITIAYEYFVGYFGATWLAGLFAGLAGIGLLTGLASPVATSDRAWVRFGAMALVLWIAISYLLPWLRGLIAQPVITDRNTIMVLPAVLILAGYSISRLPGATAQRILGIAVVILSLWCLLVQIDYYRKVTKNQFREMAQTLISFGHDLPVYTLKWNDTKYNVYFEQLGSELRSVDANVLEAKLLAGTAEPLFWIADAHRRRLQTDLEERFGLIQVAIYKAKAVVAELLVNPGLATRIDIEPAMLSGAGGNWLSTGSILWPENGERILVALGESQSTGSERNVQLDLLKNSGRVRESFAATLAPVQTTMLVEPDVAAGEEVRLVIRLADGEPEPMVWVIWADTANP